MIIAGVDPGGHTGVAIIDTDIWKLTLTRSLGLLDYFDALDMLVSFADRIGIERYVITTRTTKLSRQSDALYAIGATMHECRRQRTKLELQTPADAKRAFTDATLKKIDMWNGDDHIRDATRHALMAARRAGKEVHFDV